MISAQRNRSKDGASTNFHLKGEIGHPGIGELSGLGAGAGAIDGQHIHCGLTRRMETSNLQRDVKLETRAFCLHWKYLPQPNG